MDERLERVESKLDDEIKENASFRGEMRAFSKNMESYIGSVSRNVKDVAEDLERHKESDEAHGLGTIQKHSGSWVAWLGVGIAAVAVIAPWLWAAIKR